MKEIKLNINEQLYNEAEGILDEYGLEIQNILTTVLKRIVREGSAGFLYSKKEPVIVTSGEESKVDIESKFLPARQVQVANTLRMSKNIAKEILAKNGVSIGKDETVVYATKNSATGNYWATPRIEKLVGVWYLILNDDVNGKLYLFKIANEDGSIARDFVDKLGKRELKGETLANIQIFGDDSVNFIDKVSGASFGPYLVKSIIY